MAGSPERPEGGAKKQKRPGVPGKIALPPEHPKPLKPIKD